MGSIWHFTGFVLGLWRGKVWSMSGSNHWDICVSHSALLGNVYIVPGLQRRCERNSGEEKSGWNLDWNGNMLNEAPLLLPGPLCVPLFRFLPIFFTPWMRFLPDNINLHLWFVYDACSVCTFIVRLNNAQAVVMHTLYSIPNSHNIHA